MSPISALEQLTETTLENLYVAIGSKGGSTDGDFKITAGAAASATVASADGVSTTVTSSDHLSADAGSVSNQAAAELAINGGALGYAPIERSVCFVGPAPSKLATGTQKSERIYIGYRAVSMDAVGVAVQRDNATLFPVNFRLLPYEDAPAADGNATYGKIVDRDY